MGRNLHKKGRRLIAPAFLFMDTLLGKAEEAINFYVSQFKDSKIENIHRDPKTNAVMHAVASKLTELEMKAVAAYISGMK